MAMSLRDVLRALGGLVGDWRPGPAGAAVALRDLEFVAIDVETTGLDPKTDVAVALAAIPFSGGRARPEAGYTRLVNPGRPIPAASQAIHGIGDAVVRDAPPVADALVGFLRVCRGRPIVAHTAGFDVAVLNRAARAAGLPGLGGVVLDVGVIAHALFPSWWDLSLDGLSRLVEVEAVDRHTAAGDAFTAGRIFVKLLPLLERRAIVTVSQVLRLQRGAPLMPGGPGATGGGLAGP
jgi:DNA polymerase III epsilon subunit-like protein